METSLGSLLKILPPVDFCCVYGSSLHPNNNDKSSMEDYILGVSNPQKWHSENLKMNRDHYTSWMVPLGGAKLITNVADHIGVGVHFNPFVSWNNKMHKYGVVHMDDLVQDMLSWDRFYLSGRLQKPVRIIVDNMEIENVNLVNLRAASSAALLLLPSTFTEGELYAKICSLSYMGDLRMLFAEDKNKVKKIVEGQFELFRNMYKPLVEEYATKQLLRLSSCGDQQMNISQDCSLSATSSIVSSLPESVRNQMGMGLGETKAGQTSNKITIGSREQAAARMQKVLRRRVMISSARQAVAGFITVGAVHGIRYLGKKISKAWKSSTYLGVDGKHRRKTLNSPESAVFAGRRNLQVFAGRRDLQVFAGRWDLQVFAGICKCSPENRQLAGICKCLPENCDLHKETICAFVVFSIYDVVLKLPLYPFP